MLRKAQWKGLLCDDGRRERLVAKGSIARTPRVHQKPEEQRRWGFEHLVLKGW